MSIRNYWLEASIDGRATRLQGGPRGKDGGFELTVYIRDNGSILRAFRISGFAQGDGTLRLTAAPSAEADTRYEKWEDSNVLTLVTER